CQSSQVRFVLDCKSQPGRKPAQQVNSSAARGKCLQRTLNHRQISHSSRNNSKERNSLFESYRLYYVVAAPALPADNSADGRLTLCVVNMNRNVSSRCGLDRFGMQNLCAEMRQLSRFGE